MPTKMLFLLEDSWKSVQGELRERVGGATYAAWLEGLRPVMLERGTVYLEAETRLTADRVRALFCGTLSEILSKEIGTDLKVEIQAREAERFDALEVSPQRPVIDDGNRTAYLVLQSLLPRQKVGRPADGASTDDGRSAGGDAAGGDAAGGDSAGGDSADGGAEPGARGGPGRVAGPIAASGPRSGGRRRGSLTNDGHVSGLLDAAVGGAGMRPGSKPLPAPAADRSARFAAAASDALVNRLVPTSLYVLHGPSGVGKTFLLRWWREQVPSRSMWFDLPDLLKAFQRAHQDKRVDGLREELCTKMPLVIDEAHRISHKPALQSFLLQVLQVREANGSATILSSRWHPRDVRDLDASLGSLWLAGFVCAVEQPGPLGRLRYLRALEGKPSRNGRAPQVEALAQQTVGSYPELRAAWAASRGHTLPPRYLELIDPSRVFQRVRDRVAERFGMTKEDLVGKGQARAVSRARKILALLCQQQGLSGGEIGRFLGRTRAAVSYMLLSLQRELDKSPELRRDVEELT